MSERDQANQRPAHIKRPAEVALPGATVSAPKKAKYSHDNLPRANHPEDVMEWAEGDLGIPHIHAVKLFDNDIDMEELQQWSEDLDKAEEEMVRLCNMPPRWAEKVSKGIPLLIPAAGEFYPEETANLASFWRHTLENPPPKPCATIKAFVITSWDSLVVKRSFFVRPCYPQLFDLIITRIAMRQSDPLLLAPPGVILMGNSGIGKRYFLMYCLWALGHCKQMVYFESQNLKVGWLFETDGRVSSFPFGHRPRRLDSDPKLVYLFDAAWTTQGGPPTISRGYTIFSTSPKSTNYASFRLIVQEKRLYIPIWSIDEITKFAVDTVPDASSRDTILSSYQLFGGIPRYVFSLQDDYLAFLQNSIALCNVEQIRRSLGGLDALEDGSHRLLHYDVADDFRSISMKFASKYVEDAVFARITETQRQSALDFVFLSSVGIPAVLGIRGSWFKHFAHERLSHGGSFRVRQLVETADAKVEEWKFPAMAFLLNSFEKIEELNVGLGVYTTPTLPNFAVDGFCQFDPDYIIGVQMTVSKQHTIASTQLAEMLKQLGYDNKTTREFRVVFVVPRDVFDEYKSPQTFIGVDGNELVHLPEVITKNCRQYVLELAMS